ncbi:MAG: TIGR02597 family protein [Verrucomicrobiota bacterium]
MKSSKLATLLTALALSPAFAAETDPVGFVSVTVPANSDAVLSVPLNRAAEFKGVIQSISGNVITVAGTPAWTADQFVQALPGQPKTYAVQIASGAKEGLTGVATTNGTNTVTITVDNAEDLTGVGTVAVPVDPDGAGPLAAQADQVDIMPYWTPGTLVSGSIAPGTNILLFPTTTPGVNLSAGTILVYTGSGWLNTGNFTDATNSSLGFAQGFILRNNSASALSASIVGSVPMAKHRAVVRTFAANTAQDHWISYSSPVPTPIGQTGLGFTPGDNLLVFDNSALGQNKSASQILVYTGSGWLDTNGFANVTATFNLQPGFGYILRKAQTASAQTFVWQGLQTYLQ